MRKIINNDDFYDRMIYGISVQMFSLYKCLILSVPVSIFVLNWNVDKSISFYSIYFFC